MGLYIVYIVYIEDLEANIGVAALSPLHPGHSAVDVAILIRKSLKSVLEVHSLGNYVFLDSWTQSSEVLFLPCPHVVSTRGLHYLQTACNS